RRTMAIDAVERDLSNAAAVEHGGAERGVVAQEKIFEPSAIELERRHGREARRPELAARREIAVVAAREEVAQPELLELRRAQVRLEAQPLLKIMRADLDARLADLERRFAHRVLPLLDDEHPKMGRLLTKLARETSAGQ